MKDVLKLKGLLRSLEDTAGLTKEPDTANSKTPEKNTSKELKKIYVKSVTRILKVSDKISAGQISSDVVVYSDVKDVVVVDENERKYFEIGDRVVIGCSFEKFKYIQKKVPAWKKTLKNIYPHAGIVTDQNTKHDTTVQVYFPDIFTSCTISTAVLAKNSKSDEQPVQSKWEIGDFVQICSDKAVIKHLMKRLPDVPNKYIGKTGRIIAVTSAGIFVTFDGLCSYVIDSALLQKADSTCIDDAPEKFHPNGFRPGDEVSVISNLKKMIENQKKNGGWNKLMCGLAGEKGHITDINEDGSIDVACGYGRGWRMNCDSVTQLKHEQENDDDSDELDFKPGDKVKLKMTENIRMHLISKNIPLTFLDYLRVTGKVHYIDEDFDVWTSFNSSSKIRIKSSSLVKASGRDATLYEEIFSSFASLKPGDNVCLDVGPPNYVRAVLAKYKSENKIMEALTTSSKFLGWMDARHAAVEYADGRRYRINEKYLTIPERFGIQDLKEDFGWETVKELQEEIVNSVEKIHAEYALTGLKSKFSVDVYSMINGLPPSVEFQIKSTLVKSEQICDLLRDDCGWKCENLFKDVFLISGFKSCTQEVKVGMLYNEEIYLSSITNYTTHVTGEPGDNGGNLGAAPVRKDGQPTPRNIPKPSIKSLDEFRLLQLHDEALSRTVYFPYIVHGPTRQTAELENVQNGGHRHGNTFNISNATIHNMTF